MSLHDGLDLSRFTRVSSDKKTTTLRHRSGHELKIANSGMSPKMRERIAALKDHGETETRKAYADSDEPVSATDGAPEVAASPQALDPASPAPATQPAPAEAPVTLAPEAAPPPPQQQVQPQTAPMPAQTPVEAAPPPPPPPPPPTPQQVAQQMTQKDMQFQQDLAMGHIQPKTVQDLYASKTTLGKIGTLFGLLVSGAGSGLTGQPNAVMEMMNKQIENDFEAQKKNQENAQNWRTLTLKHELQNAQIEQMGVQNIGTLSAAGLAQAQTGKIPAEISRLKAEASQLNTQSQLGWDTHKKNLIELKMMGELGEKPPVDPSLEIKTDAQAKNLMTMGALQEMQNTANKMPDGPGKQAYLTALATVTATANQQMAQRNLQAADKIGALNALGAATAPAQQSGADDSGVDLGRLDALSRKAALGSATKMPPQIDGKSFNEQDLAKAKEDADMVARNRALAKLYDQSFKKLDGMFANSAINPAMREAETTIIVDEIAKQIAGGGVSGEKAHEMARAMFPGVKEWNGSSKAKYENTMAQFEAREASAVTGKRLGVVKPFPKFGGGQKKYKEGDISTDGKSIVKGGGWTPYTGASKQATK